MTRGQRLPSMGASSVVPSSGNRSDRYATPPEALLGPWGDMTVQTTSRQQQCLNRRI